MGYHPYAGFDTSRHPRYLVMWDLHWQLIECRQLAPAADLRALMGAAVERLAHEGWQMESEPAFGFVFINREGERRLLMLTPRDPRKGTHQSFNPFR